MQREGRREMLCELQAVRRVFATVPTAGPGKNRLKNGKKAKKSSEQQEIDRPAINQICRVTLRNKQRWRSRKKATTRKKSTNLNHFNRSVVGTIGRRV
jgi:hypothetical protein